MLKRAFLTGAVILGICFSAAAQETMPCNPTQPARFELNQASPGEMVKGCAALGRTGSFATLNNAWYGSGPLTLLDGRIFSFPRAFGWVEATPNDFLPYFTAGELPNPTAVATLTQDSNRPVDLLQKFDYVGGEVGVFYGRSTGKFSREVEQGYIVGEVIDGNTHISVGGFYEHSKASVPRISGR